MRPSSAAGYVFDTAAEVVVMTAFSVTGVTCAAGYSNTVETEAICAAPVCANLTSCTSNEAAANCGLQGLQRNLDFKLQVFAARLIRSERDYLQRS